MVLCHSLQFVLCTSWVCFSTKAILFILFHSFEYTCASLSAVALPHVINLSALFETQNGLLWAILNFVHTHTQNSGIIVWLDQNLEGYKSQHCWFFCLCFVKNMHEWIYKSGSKYRKSRLLLKILIKNVNVCICETNLVFPSCSRCEVRPFNTRDFSMGRT